MVPQAKFGTKFVTTHQDSCTVARFSRDGKFAATGSDDNSIKLLDVAKLRSYNQNKSEVGDVGNFAGARPVIRTYYEHTASITDLDFHPAKSRLCSASKDLTIKFYDFQEPTKRSCGQITETHEVSSIHFHPSGHFLLVGTSHCMVRMYDLSTQTPYTAANAKEHHYGGINQLRYSTDGSMFVSAGKDGAVKIWDAISFRCVRHIPNAHGGTEVNAVKFSQNGKYVLSSGRDSSARLWDLSKGTLLRQYRGNKQVTHKMNVEFSFNEDFVVGLDENSNSCFVWNTRTEQISQRLSGHNSLLRWVACSPVEPALITCSDDHRARFWLMD
eukprot:CAMPEP_0114618156 /NCGR_PEP_ID=MMETSP0168-20121206/7561_1 /TAXON_ID=95228 ORGANISM="Vannella sp., Strain DIVA3 517/6/12" /NCGR_SAMPLE_ID=MMETSP0168 /ASSEMBLY_ACC=CAM_ASM_000044 /LENGTH=327 /DNA_ID=CAMNT_0001829301 /DNA_START=50 /DNA_END=1033 /DNA_ORIENTATION=+